MWTARLRGWEDFRSYHEHVDGVGSRRQAIEADLAQGAEHGKWVDGYCAVCRKPTQFLIDLMYAHTIAPGVLYPNFRERLECRSCGLNNRVRASMDFLTQQAGLHSGSLVYATEQVTHFYTLLKDRFPLAQGSEYLEGQAGGEINDEGIRHEDSTNLSFASASLDAVLSFDVLEHIPDYLAALAEYGRVLKPGGKLVLTAPFQIQNHDHVVRARMTADGTIEHLLSEEYHGDPVGDGTGILCFYHFGWKLLDEIRASGFRDALMHFYWSPSLGHVGGTPFLIMGER